LFPLGSIRSNLNANLPDVSVLSVINRCILLNARSLKNKLCEFNSLLSDDHMVLSVTESWLASSVTEGMTDSSGRYSLYGNDRLTRQGGGVLCLVSNKSSTIAEIGDRSHNRHGPK